MHRVGGGGCGLPVDEARTLVRAARMMYDADDELVMVCRLGARDIWRGTSD